MFLEHRDILSVKDLLPSLASTVAGLGRLLGPCSSLKNVKDPRTWAPPRLQTQHPSLEVRQSATGTQAESCFPWRSVGMTSRGASTSLTDLFSQWEVASSPWAGLSTEGVYGVLAASSASHHLRWVLAPLSPLSSRQVVLAFSIKL